MRMIALWMIVLALSSCSITVRQYKRAHVNVCKCSIKPDLDDQCDKELEVMDTAKRKMDKRLNKLKETNPKAYERLNKKVEQARKEIKELHCGW